MSLQKHLCVSSSHVKCLQRAVLRNDLETVKGLMKDGLQLRKSDTENSFYDAVRKGYLDMVKFLCQECKINPSRIPSYLRKYNAIHLAVQSIPDKEKMWQMVKFLIDAGLEVVERHQSPYTTCSMEALKVRNGKLLKFFLDAGSNVNFVDQQGLTLLHHALLETGGGSNKLIKLLIRKGAAINLTQNITMSCPLLNFAAMQEKYDWQKIQLLIDAGAEVNSLDQQGISPLAMAAYKGHFALVEKLIDVGADVNFTRKWTNSALEVSIRACRRNIVQLLLLKHADIEVKDIDGNDLLKSSAGYLKSRWRDEYSEILKDVFSHGALHCKSRKYIQLFGLLQNQEINMSKWNIITHE